MPIHDVATTTLPSPRVVVILVASAEEHYAIDFLQRASYAML